MVIGLSISMLCMQAVKALKLSLAMDTSGTVSRSQVENVSGYRCVSDCIFSGCEFPSRKEIDYEIISTVILLPSAESLKKDCCQLQAKVCARSTC